MSQRRRFRLGAPLALAALAVTAAGCGGNSGASEGETYTIAYLGTLSGASPQLGINERNAVQLAIDEANASGDLPFTLEFAESDDAGDPAQAPAAAQKLVDDDSVVAIVGPAYSGPTKAIGQILAQAGVAAVSPSATNPTLTSLGFDTFFRVVPPDDAQGSEVSKYMASVVGAKSVYLVDDKTDYGVGLADVVEESLQGADVSVTREGVPITKDYTAIAQKVASAGTDAVFYSGYYEQAAPFVKATKDDPNVDPASKEFAEAYKAEFNANPGTYSSESYDATNAIIEAMRGIDGDITRESVLEAIRGIDYQGITKTIKFSDNGEVEGTTIYMYEVTDGARAVLGTTTELVK